MVSVLTLMKNRLTLLRWHKLLETLMMQAPEIFVYISVFINAFFDEGCMLNR